MKDKGMHYTTEHLNRLLDGQLTQAEEQILRSHLVICNECRLAFDNLSRIDIALKEVPVMETHPDFTRTVMERILAPPKSSLAFRLLEKVPYIFGLLIVLGVMIAAFVLTGVFNQAQIDQTRTVTTGVIDKLGESIAGSIGGFTALLIQYLPFAFSKGSMGVAFFAVAVVVMLAAVDRLVGRKVLQK